MYQVQHNVIGQLAPGTLGLDPGATGAGGSNGITPGFLGSVGSQTDGVTTNWWNPTQSSVGAANAGGLAGLFGSLITGLNQSIDAIGSWLGQMFGEQKAEGSSAQNVSNATFSSVGDPHLSETGTLLDGSGNAHAIDNHFDSMNAHDNLISSQDFDGGYRVSTAVTTPGANGVTMNQRATVHTNSNADTVSMQNDGSISISNNGTAVSLQNGRALTLADGELVSRGTDGSLTVAETNASGGSISTTMRANGFGVDVTTSVQNAAVGGDIANTNVGMPTLANPPAGTNPPTVQPRQPIMRRETSPN